MSRLCFDEQLVGRLQPLNSLGSFFSRNLTTGFHSSLQSREKRPIIYVPREPQINVLQSSEAAAGFYGSSLTLLA